MGTENRLSAGIALGWNRRERLGRGSRASRVPQHNPSRAAAISLSRFEELLLERLAVLERSRAASQAPPSLEW